MTEGSRNRISEPCVQLLGILWDVCVGGRGRMERSRYRRLIFFLLFSYAKLAIPKV